MYRVLLKRKAEKDLDRLQGSIWQRIRDALLALAQNPRPRGCRKLRGITHAYRTRVGDYRIIYEVDDRANTVTVLRIVHRQEGYRNL